MRRSYDNGSVFAVNLHKIRCGTDDGCLLLNGFPGVFRRATIVNGHRVRYGCRYIMTCRRYGYNLADEMKK